MVWFPQLLVTQIFYTTNFWEKYRNSRFLGEQVSENSEDTRHFLYQISTWFAHDLLDQPFFIFVVKYSIIDSIEIKCACFIFSKHSQSWKRKPCKNIKSVSTSWTRRSSLTPYITKFIHLDWLRWKRKMKIKRQCYHFNTLFIFIL